MENVVTEVWNRTEEAMRKMRMETHRTRAIFASALYAAAAAMTLNGSTAQEISEAAFRIENQPLRKGE